MRGRRVLDLSFGFLVAGIASYALLHTIFSRLHNDSSCEDTVPSNSAQAAGIADVRARKEKVCSAFTKRCEFSVSGDVDGTFRVSLYFYEKDFFEGCVYLGQDEDVFVYSREGKLIRIEGAPYALD